MKKISFIGIFLFLISCNYKKVIFSRETIKELSKGDFKTPSAYGYLYIFVRVKEDKLASTNINQLHTMYVTDYSKAYDNFGSFLFEALNQKRLFSENCTIKIDGSIFKLNKQVTKNYEEFGFSKFLNQYCEDDGGKFSVKKQYVTQDTLFTILYYFFINKYEITADDYIGKYYVAERRSLID